jgi:hypothetical protein
MEEKLGQLKVATQWKLESIADSANQSLNKAQTIVAARHLWNKYYYYCLPFVCFSIM